MKIIKKIIMSSSDIPIYKVIDGVIINMTTGKKEVPDTMSYMLCNDCKKSGKESCVHNGRVKFADREKVIYNESYNKYPDEEKPNKDDWEEYKIHCYECGFNSPSYFRHCYDCKKCVKDYDNHHCDDYDTVVEKLYIKKVDSSSICEKKCGSQYRLECRDFNSHYCDKCKHCVFENFIHCDKCETCVDSIYMTHDDTFGYCR